MTALESSKVSDYHHSLKNSSQPAFGLSLAESFEPFKVVYVFSGMMFLEYVAAVHWRSHINPTVCAHVKSAGRT